MEQYQDYAQVLTLNLPPIEVVAGPKESPDLAKLANDSMAELVKQVSETFSCVRRVAAVEQSRCHAARSGAGGERAWRARRSDRFQRERQAAGRAEFRPLFSLMAQLITPSGCTRRDRRTSPTTKTRTSSKYDLWWAFGWPYETSVAMGRLALSGVFDENPDLKIITHHMGAMIPYFEGRIGGGWISFGRRTDDEHDVGTLGRLQKRPFDYFPECFTRTRLCSAPCRPPSAALAFFGSDHVLFGT